MTYQPTPQKTEGGQREAIVSDDNSQELLSGILKELKKISFQLMILTDNDITNEEIN